jgi:hypothetical protein
MDILKQRKWTEDDLRQAGFRPYARKKTVVLARELRASESPKRIKTTWDTLVAYTGYMICYDAGRGKVRADLDDYHHWPVAPQIFLMTYRKWDQDITWKPNAAEKHLMELGCKPFYKCAGVWAKHLKAPMRIQSLEGVEPITVPVGGWVCIGVEGEPSSMTTTEFRKRYRRATATSKIS